MITVTMPDLSEKKFWDDEELTFRTDDGDLIIYNFKDLTSTAAFKAGTWKSVVKEAHRVTGPMYTA